MYRPLPDCLTIKESSIEGLGLFATKDIEAGEPLGVTHINIPCISNEMYRTPLGGFYNHSEEPNCKRVGRMLFDKTGDKIGWEYVLETIRPIKEGEELTVEYTLYKL